MPPAATALMVEWKGWRINPLVCYDLRFPVFSRNRYDVERAGRARFRPAAVRRQLAVGARLCLEDAAARARDREPVLRRRRSIASAPMATAWIIRGDSAVIDFLGQPLSECTRRGSRGDHDAARGRARRAPRAFPGDAGRRRVHVGVGRERRSGLAVVRCRSVRPDRTSMAVRGSERCGAAEARPRSACGNTPAPRPSAAAAVSQQHVERPVRLRMVEHPAQRALGAEAWCGGDGDLRPGRPLRCRRCWPMASPTVQPWRQAEWMPPAVTGETMPAASPVRITPGAAIGATGPPQGISPARMAEGRSRARRPSAVADAAQQAIDVGRAGARGADGGTPGRTARRSGSAPPSRCSRAHGAC